MVLGDPQNFIVVNTWDVRIRKAAEGKDAVLNDMRYYACYLDDDPIIQETNGTVLCEGIDLPF